MVFYIIALLALVSIAVLPLLLFKLLKKKRLSQNYGTEKNSMIAAVAVLFVSIILLFSGFVPVPWAEIQRLEQPIQNNPQPEPEPDTVLFVEVDPEYTPCESSFCFQAEVKGIMKGNFSIGETITIETDCDFLFGELTLEGFRKEAVVAAPCSSITSFIVDPDIGLEVPA